MLMKLQCDQPKEGAAASPAQMEQYCQDRGFNRWYETSAKENINIDEAARCLVTKVISSAYRYYQYLLFLVQWSLQFKAPPFKEFPPL